MTTPWTLNENRVFSSNPAVRSRAADLYGTIADLPIVAPHGHVAPELLADAHARFTNPAELFIIPDHYVFRMLYSQGVPMESLGVPREDGGPIETDPRAIWRTFCEHFHLFQGTPTGLWMKAELVQLLRVDVRPSAETADALYDQIDARLKDDDFTVRALFERFNVEFLTTTDAATADLSVHASIQADGLPVGPTFRPDAAMQIAHPDWRSTLDALGERSGVTITSLNEFREALRVRRQQFVDRGAKATDHGLFTSFIEPLGEQQAESLFKRGLAGEATTEDAEAFHAHMLFEMAGMSVDDGLVMQVHFGSRRNHHTQIYERFGLDKGADIPVAMDFTRGLHSLLNAYGSDPRFRLVTFTLDESTYARELAPMAGHYPALRLGAPWWFFDSVLGFERFLDRVVETAGVYNLAGFNDDTRAFASIPARHDVWRRAVSNWLAGQVERGLVDADAAPDMARWLAYDAAKSAYRLT